MEQDSEATDDLCMDHTPATDYLDVSIEKDNLSVQEVSGDEPQCEELSFEGQTEEPEPTYNIDVENSTFAPVLSVPQASVAVPPADMNNAILKGTLDLLTTEETNMSELLLTDQHILINECNRCLARSPIVPVPPDLVGNTTVESVSNSAPQAEQTTLHPEILRTESYPHNAVDASVTPVLVSLRNPNSVNVGSAVESEEEAPGPITNDTSADRGPRLRISGIRVVEPPTQGDTLQEINDSKYERAIGPSSELVDHPVTVGRETELFVSEEPNSTIVAPGGSTHARNLAFLTSIENRLNTLEMELDRTRNRAMFDSIFHHVGYATQNE